MAPISFPSPEPRPQPHVEVRQGPTPYAITLTITRETTTLTSIITLGTDSGAIAAPTNALTTTTTAPVQTTAPAPAKTTSDNNGVVIGAVLGTFLGLAVLIALTWKCCFYPQSAIWSPREYDDDSSSFRTYSDGSSRSSRVRVRVRRRGGDGEHRRRVRRNHGVRRPRRAYVRRERRGSYGGSSGGNWSDEKRSTRTRRKSSGMVVRNGMIGWAFGGGRGRRNRYGTRDRRWVEDERVEMRFTTDD